jgi:hemimethylated DNA binding protein
MVTVVGSVHLGGGKEQPFYNVLVDERQPPCQTTYVAQVNMVVRTPSSAEAIGSIDLPIRHPEVRAAIWFCVIRTGPTSVYGLYSG